MMRRGRIFALLAPLALVIAVLGSGPGARVSGASSAESPALASLLNSPKQASRVPFSVSTTSGAPLSGFNTCPTGYRAIFMTNNCNQDIWFAENPSAAPGGTPQCPDPTDSGNDNFGCPTGTTCNSGGVCVTSCTDPGVVNAPDCGPNQTCTNGGFTQMAIPSSTATPATIYECFANYYEPSPVSTPTPSSGSGWDLAANGGRSVICMPEASPSATASPGASCTENSDCGSYECASQDTDASIPNLPGNFCLPNETGCKCANTITWSGNFWGRTGCTYSGGNSLSCKTGDCDGDVNCTIGPPPPATLTEMTLLTPSDPGSQDSYDVSMVSGFNLGYSIKAVKGSYSGTCGDPGVGCSFNINANCPAELALKDGQTTIGCYTPDKACAESSPPAVLNCTANVPFLCATSKDCPYGQQNPAEPTMTCSAGQCVCTTDTDCPQGFSCSSGSCTQTSGPTATWTDLYGCANFYNLSPLNSNIYPSWLTGTAEETGITCGCPSWSTGCLAHNYNWQTAPIGNGNSNTVEDYYQIFHNGCSSAYSYAYDDAAGTDSCAPTSSAAASGPSYDIEFCPAASSSPTATPTATASSTASATATSTVTATATETTTATAATATATSTGTATPTATATSTPTSTATATASATSTATATGTVTATATSTPTTTPTSTSTSTPSPTGTATPNCTAPFGYLTTVPSGTLAFGDVAPGAVSTASLTVENQEPAGTFKLSEKISNIGTSKFAKYFSVTGGTCKTDNKLGPGDTCTYNLQLKGATKIEGDAVNANFVITGKFAKNACPAKDFETTSVTLAGSVLEPNARPHDAR